MLAAHVGFSFFYSEGERRVTAKNSHQLACHFSVVFRLTLGFTETSVHLVSVVGRRKKKKSHFKSAFILRNTANIFSAGHLGRSLG